MKMNSPKYVVGIAVGSIVAVFAIAGLVGLISSRKQGSNTEFNNFKSCTEMADRLNLGLGGGYPVYDGGVGVPPRDDNSGGGTTGGEAPTPNVPGYSPTNVQVEGVDEADIVKTDGKHIYVAVAKKIVVLDAAEPKLSKPLAEINLSFTPSGMFIDEDRLAVFGFTSRYYYYDIGISPYRSNVVMNLYDISQAANPKVVHKFDIDGTYVSARLKDGVMYLVTNYNSGLYSPVDVENIEEVMPQVASVDSDRSIRESDYNLTAGCTDTSFYGQYGNGFVEVLVFDVQNPSNYKVKSLVGGVQTVFMSLNNLYLTSPDYEYEVIEGGNECPPLSRVLGLCPYATSTSRVVPVSNVTKTNIFKLSVDATEVKFAAVGTVEGTLLNQFSLDEHSGYLRAATTSGGERGDTSNNIYVLDKDMKVVGELEDLAGGERIFAVRYMGDRAYMVTFRQVDPLFVIDLSQPTTPKVLGELKIPGFSDYLHPYDQNHVIGFGKDADPSSGVAAGVKLALFDVTNPTQPKEVSKLILGGRGSDSEVLRDHKALLFDRERDLLVIPLSLNAKESSPFKYGEREFVGFGIYGLDTIKGFTQKARVSMLKKDAQPEDYYYAFARARSLFVGNSLFLIDNQTVKSVSLENFKQLGELIINNNPDYIYY